MSISATIITLNEERNIEACLESVRFCDELIVLDSGSTDRTVELARRWADRVETAPFRDFADQKNRAAALASGDWVLSVDADERVTPALQQEILAAVQGPEVGFHVARLSNFFGHWLRHGGFFPDHQLRLYRPDRGQWMGRVHERVQVDGAVGNLEKPLLHYPYASLDEWLQAINRNSSISARWIESEGTAPSLRRALTTPAYLFTRRLIRERAYRDGTAGVLAAGIAAFGGFLVHAKHWANVTAKSRGRQTLPSAGAADGR